MMDHGQPPDQKRQRVESWSSSNHQSERPHLPPPRPYHDAGSPYTASGPENPLDRDRRRHSEHQPPPYDPDPRRPSSGPHTGPPHVYHPHQPHSAPPYAPSSVVTMKREVGEEYSSPPSRGNGHDIGPPHGYGTLPPPFENQNQTPGPIPYRSTGSFPPPQSPMPATEPYPHGLPGYGPNSQAQRGDPFASVSYPPQSTQPQKKKAQRASQACDSCRSLKAKCDEGRPTCSTCREKNFTCVYKDPPPKQQDKTQIDILEGMQELKSLFGTQMEFFKQQLLPLTNGMRALQDWRVDVDQRLDSQGSPNLKKDEAQVPIQTYPKYPDPSAEGTGATQQREQEFPHASPSTPEMQTAALADDLEQPEEAGDPVKPGPSSIPVNHTTGAAKLLLVGPIAELTAAVNPYKNKKDPPISFDKYPMVEEERRGLMRVYGRGQGIDRPPGYEKDPLIDHPVEGTPSETTSDPPTPPAGEEWGQVGGLTPPFEDTPIMRFGNESTIGLGVNLDGLPDLSPEIVRTLVGSYMSHMNIMHPILVRSRLDTLVEVFLKTVPEIHHKRKRHPLESVSAGFLGSSSVESPGAKRKRSPTVLTESYEPPSIWHKPGHPFRSISTALVLLVLALGSICMHKDRIPELVSEKEAEEWENGSHSSRNGHPRSPLQTHSSMSDVTGLPSPQDGERMQPPSRRISVDTPPNRPGRGHIMKNHDVIPGLNYYALATDIIGNQIGGNSLQHVHANILAGLYQGQLGRVLESHAYISIACHALQIILNPKLDRFKKLKDDGLRIPPKDNPLVFAFWTCLQLESDIVAELNLPMSGILTLEENMPAPNFMAALEFDRFDPIHIESYMTQLQLRKHLNQLHTMFYKPEESEEPHASKPSFYPTIEAVEENLRDIKRLAPNLAWEEGDPPAKDILGARLRAKFFGAEVITYRSFVLKILVNSAAKSPKSSTVNVIQEYKANIGDLGGAITRTTRVEDIDPKVWGYAKRCIKALFNSTKAFHRLGDPGRERLIVTNIWGTAHAQWGNVLTLLAAFDNPVLGPLINRAELEDLLRTTLSFLKLNMHNQSSLVYDYKILKHVGQRLKLLPEKRKQQIVSDPSTSFGSNNSGGDVAMSGS